MKVLSLFDGMSCGRIALDQLGIPVEKYYASEIDKYAIQVSQANYPDIQHVGDICKLDPKDYQDVDLMLAGSPCQGFSFAGKQLAFDDPRSALFFEFIRLLKEIKPKYFLLENVRMKKEFLQVISEQVSECYPEVLFGIEPIFINSSLLSAQSRQRYYWTNIPGIQEPEDKGIVLRDILEDNYNSDRDKSYCIDANYSKTGAKPHHYKDKYRRQLVNKPIKVGMNVEEVKVRKHEVNISGLQHLLREMKKESGKTNKQIAEETNMPVTKVEHWFRTDSSFAIPGDNIWLKLKEVLGIKTEVFDQEVMEFVYRDGVYETKQRVYSDEGKSPTITASNTEQYIETKPKKAYDIPREILKDNERQRRVYDPSGKSPTILGRSDSPKITTPKQIGIATDINGHDILKRVYSPDGKSPTVNTCQGGNREPKVVTGGAIRGRAYDNKGKRMDRDGSSVANKTTQMLELRKDDKSNAITTVGKDSVAVNEDLTWRKLTPLECERLQTVPDNYTNHVSNTQRYKMLGNGWTVAVIKHIFMNMDYERN